VSVVAVAVTPVSARRARDLIAAEWIKFWSPRSTPITLACLIAWYGYRGWQGAHDSYGQYRGFSPAQRGDFDKSGFFGIGVEWLPIMVATGAVGALTVISEHASGLIRTTFTAVPDRLRVVAAKVVVLTAAMTGFGAVVTAEVYLLDRLVLGGRHLAFALTEPGAPRLVVATVGLMAVCALIGMAFGALIRDTAASMVAVSAYYLMLPALFKKPTTRWAIDFGNSLPCYSWARLTFLGRGPVIGGATVDGSAIALVLWALISAIVVAVVLNRRDV
jgi:hypothetical protein